MLSSLKFKASKPVRFSALALVFVFILFAKIYNANNPVNSVVKNEPLASQVGSLKNKASFVINTIKEIAPKDLYPVSVSFVIDGDTFSGAGKNRYRIAFIDAPEKKQMFGAEASEFLKKLIEGKEIQFKELYLDKYGRAVGHVYIDGVDIAEILVQFGYAWEQAEKYNASKEYALKLYSLESEARNNKSGLWALDDIQPPFEYRKENENAKIAIP